MQKKTSSTIIYNYLNDIGENDVVSRQAKREFGKPKKANKSFFLLDFLNTTKDNQPLVQQAIKTSILFKRDVGTF